jgi:hypothetical protein
MIKVFDDLYDAVLYIETEAEQSYRSEEYFKAELLRTPDGRWRVGFITKAQLEMFNGFKE